jgi:hypothetical protein
MSIGKVHAPPTASRQAATPKLEHPRGFGTRGTGPGQAGHDFARVSVVGGAGTGPIQPMMGGRTSGGSGQEEDDEDRRSKRPRVGGLAAIAEAYAASSGEEDEDENPAPVPRSIPSTTTSTGTAGASAPHPATSTAAVRVPATLLPRGPASSASSGMMPPALLVSPASAPRPAATPIPHQAPSEQPSQSASFSSRSLTNADFRAMLHSSRKAPRQSPSASFDWWNAEATHFHDLDDSTLVDVHQSLATGQKRTGSGNRFGIQGVANRVDESGDYAGDPRHHHATLKTQKQLVLAGAEMDRRRLPVSEEARWWAAAPLALTCKPPSTPRKDKDPDDPGGSARRVMKRKLGT